jgi:hypothetical protein
VISPHYQYHPDRHRRHVHHHDHVTKFDGR